MTAVVLVSDGVERLLGSRDKLADHDVGFNGVLSLTAEIQEKDAHRGGTHFPYSLVESAGRLQGMTVGMPSAAEEEELDYQWSLRVAGLLGLPIDYDRAEELFFSRMLRLLSGYDESGGFERLAAKIAGRERGDVSAYDYAQEVLAIKAHNVDMSLSFERLESEICGLSRERQCDAEREFDAGHTECEWTHELWHFNSHDMVRAIFEISHTLAYPDSKTALTDWNLHPSADEVIAQPHVREAKRLLLEALREARVDQATASVVLPGKKYHHWACPICEVLSWTRICEDMSGAEREKVKAEVDRLQETKCKAELPWEMYL